MSTVTFASKCWGGDYKKFLAGAFERKRDAIEYSFSHQVLLINNGVPEDIDFGSISTIRVNPEVSQTIFRVNNANHYATGELSAIFASGFDSYLCYIQGDCITQGGDWVTPGIAILESEPDVMVISPHSEVNTWHDKDGYDHYMSDQAWLVRVSDFLKPEVYQVEGTDPDYPSYALDSFEALVGRYLKSSGKKRKILSDFYVQHPTY